MPSTALLPAWTRSASLSLAVHGGVLGVLLLASPLGSVRGTERAGPEPSLRFVPRTASAAPAEMEPEPLPELAREPHVEPTLVRPVPVPPALPEEPLPEPSALARVEFLPRAHESVLPDELRRAPVAAPEKVARQDVAPSAAEPAPPPADVLAPERDRSGAEEGVVTLPVPRPEACPEPVYPARARRRRLEGSVLCRIEVAADGEVVSVAVDRSSGHDILDRAAREALGAWRFEPGSRDGRPSAMVVWKRIDFRLPR